MLVGERTCHGVGILVRGLGLVERGQTVRQRLFQRRVHVIGRSRGGLGIEVLQQVAGVFGEQGDRLALDLRHVGLALADGELPIHLVPGVLECLRVDLGDDLVRVVGL